MSLLFLPCDRSCFGKPLFHASPTPRKKFRLENKARLFKISAERKGDFSSFLYIMVQDLHLINTFVVNLYGDVARSAESTVTLLNLQ